MFELVSKFKPSGDQPQAIEKLVKGIESGVKEQVLLGATGTGKTFTMANVIQRTNKQTLILAHNKTLAGQLYAEMKELFPNNHVCYFVSYYDYYHTRLEAVFITHEHGDHTKGLGVVLRGLAKLGCAPMVYVNRACVDNSSTLQKIAGDFETATLGAALTLSQDENASEGRNKASVCDERVVCAAGLRVLPFATSHDNNKCSTPFHKTI